jgi:cell division protein FtsQ
LARSQAKAVQREAPAPRRRGPLLLLAAVLAVAVAGVGTLGYLVAEPQTLPVRTLRVHGETGHLDREALRGVVMPYVGAGFVALDVAGIQRAVEDLPWVYRAAVRRVWPDVLDVSIEEQQPLARWAQGGLVNRQGERFAPSVGDVEAALPLFAGPEGTAGTLTKRYREMRRIVAPLGLKIAELGLDQRRSWHLRLGNGLTLLLGRDEYYRRLLRFVRVYSGVLADKAGRIKQVDLRYTNGFAVRWADAAGAQGGTGATPNGRTG